MKEYICKGCVHEKNCTELKCDRVAGCNFYITKADICREFAYKLKGKFYFCDDLMMEYGITKKSGYKIIDLIDNVLAEMENEE